MILPGSRRRAFAAAAPRSSRRGPGGAIGARLLLAVLAAALVLGSCSDPGSPEPPSTSALDAASLLAGFASTTITVIAPDGTSRTYCVLVADTEPLRRQGLMFVEDPSLGGYDGMAFRFDEDVEIPFWMRNTRLPLSIAYLRADGTVLSTVDMEPCPDGEDCPRYASGGPYRLALEVTRGGLDRLGIVPGARVVVDVTGCTPDG